MRRPWFPEHATGVAAQPHLVWLEYHEAQTSTAGYRPYSPNLNRTALAYGLLSSPTCAIDSRCDCCRSS